MLARTRRRWLSSRVGVGTFWGWKKRRWYSTCANAMVCFFLSLLLLLLDAAAALSLSLVYLAGYAEDEKFSNEIPLSKVFSTPFLLCHSMLPFPKSLSVDGTKDCTEFVLAELLMIWEGTSSSKICAECWVLHGNDVNGCGEREKSPKPWKCGKCV